MKIGKNAVVVLFDIDGTLVSTGSAGRIALDRAFREIFELDGPTGLGTEVPLAGRTDRAIAGDLFERHKIPFSEPAWERLIEAYLAHLPAAMAERIGRVLPGILPLLDRLDELETVTLGLLTGNTRRGAKVKLSHFALDNYFPFGGFGDEQTDRREVARQALAEAITHGGSPIVGERVVVIGDTPLDVDCARAIGARAVAVATGGHDVALLREYQPDLLLEDLADPKPFWKLLQQLDAVPKSDV